MWIALGYEDGTGDAAKSGALARHGRRGPVDGHEDWLTATADDRRLLGTPNSTPTRRTGSRRLAAGGDAARGFQRSRRDATAARPHGGLDIAAPRGAGAPVADGTVIVPGRDGGPAPKGPIPPGKSSRYATGQPGVGGKLSIEKRS